MNDTVREIELKPCLLEKRIVRVPFSGCWLWTGATNSRGYGHLLVGGRHVLAHRYSLEIVNRPVPDGMVADHICKVRSCVNPDHLNHVTPRQNTLLKGFI